MHRIEAPGATEDNRFTEGNPASGVPATTVSAAIMNAIQGELATVIEAAGLTLQTADTDSEDQLLAALNAMGVNTGQFQNYTSLRTYTTGEVVRGSDGQFYEFYDRDQAGTVQGVDPTNADNRPHVWMVWDGVKPGSTIEWRSENLPEGYVENDGAEISRADYRRVFAVHGTTHGAGDGSTTFLLPDDRGEFKRGWDNGRGVDAGRTLAGHQMDQMQQITGSISNLNANDHDGNAVTTGALSVILGSTAGSAFASSEARVESILLDSADSPDARTGDSTYPRNNAAIYLTKI